MRRSSRTTSAAFFEPLEQRQMLSASIDYTDGILNINGDPSAKTAVVIHSAWRLLSVTGISATTIANIAKQIGSKNPSMIRINLGSNKDTINTASNVTVPMYVSGGAGNDTILTGSGNDTILGGTGNDSITTAGGTNYVEAGSGDDIIKAGKNDSVWGEAGNDVVTGTADLYNGPPASLTTDSVQAQNFLVDSINDPTVVGFSVSDMEVATVTNGVVGASTAIPMHLVSVTGNTSIATETFGNSDSSILVSVRLTHSGSLTTMEATVTNNSSLRIVQLALSMPRVWANNNANYVTMSGFQGGAIQPWPTTAGYTFQSGATWPGMNYSPVAAFYDQTTNNGLGVLSFNNRLDSTKISWTLYNGWVQPASYEFPDLDHGQSAVYEMAMLRGSNMPTQIGTYYRQMYLAPFMASLGIPEATYQKTGVWGMADWVNAPQTLSDVVEQAMNKGASGFVQWAPGDGSVPYYNPYTPAYPWASGLSAASKLSGLQALGVLIDPFVSQEFQNADGTWSQTQQDLDNPAVQQQILAQRNDMLAHGVNFAFWDTGTQTRNGSSALSWINTLWEFKRVGITVAPESSCDIAAWITGAVIYGQYNFNQTFTFNNVVTPHATTFAVQNYDSSQTVNGQTMQWWDEAQSKGVVPILTQTQLQERWTELGL